MQTIQSDILLNPKDDVRNLPVSPQFEIGGIEEESDRLVDDAKNSKRNFYMSLFKIYSEMPFNTCMKNFAKIYNDVFSFEKPANV